MKVDVLSVMYRLIGNTRTMAGLTGDPRTRDHLVEGEQARAAVAELIEAAEIMERCAYTVSRDINPRGYEWCISYLDEALPILRAALAKVQP